MICKVCKIEVADIKYHSRICMYKQFNKTKMTNTIPTTNLVPYKKSLSLIESKANALTIRTDEEIESAADILSQITVVQNKVKAEKEKITKPASLILKWARETFGPIENDCLRAITTIKVKMVSYDAKKQAETLKKLSAIADKVASGKMSLETASDKIDRNRQVNSYSGETGAIQFRINRVAVITDEAKLPRKYLVPDMVRIRADLLAGEVISGAEIKEEKIVARGRA